MCGIVGAVSTRNIVPILLEGLKRLEYRGYDSCGVAVHQDAMLRRARSTARVAELQDQVEVEHIASAGPRMARRQYTTRTRTSLAARTPGTTRPAASRWSTTASSRTTTSCAPSCRPGATTSPARPTPKSSRTSSTSFMKATCSKPYSMPRCDCAAPMP